MCGEGGGGGVTGDDKKKDRKRKKAGEGYLEPLHHNYRVADC